MNNKINIVLGPSGVGKTTLCRQLLYRLGTESGFSIFEHKTHLPVDIEVWKNIDAELGRSGKRGILFLDEMTNFQHPINLLSEHVHNKGAGALSILIAAHPAIWHIRTKTLALTRKSATQDVARLNRQDLQSIVQLLRNQSYLSKACDPKLLAMSDSKLIDEIERKLNSDLFVSMKHLLDTKSLDEIVLREFSLILEHSPDSAEVYKAVCFLEAVGKHVHRQLVMRVANIDVQELSGILNELESVVFEEERDLSEGIFLWRTRHQRIANIITQSKFSPADRQALIEKSISALNPAIACERQYGSYLCNSDLGIDSLDRSSQDSVYELLVNNLPFERVPRHRQIRNLLHQDRFGETEIAISNARDNGMNDSVIDRYSVELTMRKAQKYDFLETADRINLYSSAHDMAGAAVSRRPNDQYNYLTLAKAALALSIETGEHSHLVDAVKSLEGGYDLTGEDQMLNWIAQYRSELLRFERQH